MDIKRGPTPPSKLPIPTYHTLIIEDMESFFKGWVSRLEHLLKELLAVPHDRPDAASDVVTRVLAHYEDYLKEKSRLAARDVIAVYSPTWLTPYERTYLWIAGCKPSLAFGLLDKAVSDLLPEQMKAVAELQRATTREEGRLSEEMARVEEAVAATKVLSVVRGSGVARAEAVGPMVDSLKLLLGSADALRMRTAVGLVEILNPVQSVGFLTAAIQLQLRLRGWGQGKAAAA